MFVVMCGWGYGQTAVNLGKKKAFVLRLLLLSHIRSPHVCSLRFNLLAVPTTYSYELPFYQCFFLSQALSRCPCNEQSNFLKTLLRNVFVQVPFGGVPVRLRRLSEYGSVAYFVTMQ